MSIYSSRNLTRKKAMEIVSEAMSKDDDLKDMLNVILEKYTFRNCYRLVADHEPNDDNDDGIALWRNREPV